MAITEEEVVEVPGEGTLDLREAAGVIIGEEVTMVSTTGGTTMVITEAIQDTTADITMGSMKLFYMGLLV